MKTYNHYSEPDFSFKNISPESAEAGFRNIEKEKMKFASFALGIFEIYNVQFHEKVKIFQLLFLYKKEKLFAY